MIEMLENVIMLAVYAVALGIFVIAALHDKPSPCNIPEDCGNCAFPCEKHQKRGTKR